MSIPLPLRYSDATLRGILSEIRVMAMVGASGDWKRPSFFAMKYLQRRGYRVIPINPGRAGTEILGATVYASLADVPVPIDIVVTGSVAVSVHTVVPGLDRARVDVVLQVVTVVAVVVRAVVAVLVHVVVADAAEIAQAAGIQVIMDRCPKIEFARLSGELSWSGINTRIITSKVLKAPRA